MAREAGERSSGYDQLAITMEERFRNLIEDGGKMKALEAPGVDRSLAKIQKVIFLLRDHKHFVKYFEPRVASLGPIHHGNPKYQLGEKYKLRLAYEFVQSCEESIKDGKSTINLLYEVKEEIKVLRECFEKEVTNKYDDEALAWMLFVDGCAMLQYILCVANDEFKKFNIKNDSVAFACQDLFLLENQVPYGLLKLLMSLSGKENKLKSSIASFIGNVSYQQPKPIEREPTHLLDLLRTTLLGSDPLRSSKHDTSSEKATKASEITTEASDPSRSSKPDTHFEKATKASEKEKVLQESISVTIEEASDSLTSSKSNPPSGETHSIWPCRKKAQEGLDWQSYRNVQELKASGIQLKCSNNSCLRDISFRRGSVVLCFYPGYLSLPPIIVDDSTGPKFMNLIAYEMCLDFENDFGITSYISFLDSLIDEVNDVKDLRKAHILHNFLGSDQEVVELFNEIGTDLVPSAEAYKNVKLQIQEYYDSNWMTWMAQVFHDHFSSPWTIIAFVFVLLALTLSLTQTWFAAHPPGNN